MQLFFGIQSDVIKTIFIIIFMNEVTYKDTESKGYIGFLVSALMLFTNILIPKLIIYRRIEGLLIYIIDIMLIILLYKEDSFRKLNSYLLAYLCVKIASIFTNINIVEEIFHNIYITIFSLIILIIMLRICNRGLKQIINIINAKSRYMIILAFINLIVNFWITSELTKEMFWMILFKLITVTLLCAIVIVFLIYFTRIQNKSEKINEINKALENKNNELRRIKHDYGAQISYLYGLCLLKRWGELGKTLERIYEKNKSVLNAVYIADDTDSIIYKALEPALNEGIHIIIKENIKINSIDIDHNYLFKIISHIRYTAVKSMDGQGIIIATVNEKLGNVIVEIENSKLNDKVRDVTLHKIIDLLKVIERNITKIFVRNITKCINAKIYIKNEELSRKVKVIIPIKNTK